MCWLSKNHPIKRSAQNPIIVYKVVTYIDSLECRSLYQFFKYAYKHVYREYIGIESRVIPEIRECEDIHRWVICRGFHSYATMDKALQEYEEAIEISYGKIALVECIIPKDSTFYKNEKDEIVSDRIIINRILKTNAKLPCAWNIIKLFIIILLSCFILFKLFIS